MEPRDIQLRNGTYWSFVELGRAPSADEVAEVLTLAASIVREGWQRLHMAHALVLNQSGSEIRMANPFSAVPTAYRVWAGGRWWYANCAWDAFGICAALHSDGRIEASCPDCGFPIAVDVNQQRPDDPSLLFHCLVPAAHWWDDIVFTQGTMNLFRSEEHVSRWLGGRPPGATLGITKLGELAHAWWWDRLAPDWLPRTREQNQALLQGLGLIGPFWRLS